ncbi:hypothetical protein [Yersinia proxima]|uniref:hypothetical protein n=1 Tax=Yersinia proxima TaxID=2890316 RepID=UPI003D69A2E4
MSENKTQGLSIGQLGEINATLNTRVTELENKLHALLAEKRSLYVSLFNHGYGSGHHHTVEGCYTDIHRSDITTYHDDVVGELVEDLLRDMPATTQALNEIKAQGVDELSEAFNSWADDSNGDYEAERHWAVASKEALSFAASLRGSHEIKS